MFQNTPRFQNTPSPSSDTSRQTSATTNDSSNPPIPGSVPDPPPPCSGASVAGNQSNYARSNMTGSTNVAGNQTATSQPQGTPSVDTEQVGQ